MISEGSGLETPAPELVNLIPGLAGLPETLDLFADKPIIGDDSPLVTVIVPVAKTVPLTIRACLRSLANQDYVNKEILIIDSSFDSNLRKVAETYSAKVYTSSLSKAEARNLGVQMSHGSVILHVDADMFLSQRVLSNCVALIRQGFDAIVIPESATGPGFLHQCRRLEKNAYMNSDAMEAVRCVTKKMHCDVGGFDKDTGQIDEFPYHAKILKAGAKIARSQELILVSEPILNLDKRFDQGRNVKAYRSKYADRFRLQFSPLERARAYADIARERPFHFATLVVLKALELAALCGGLASFRGKSEDDTIRRKKIANHFDTLGETYEGKFRETPGGNLADDEEKELLMSSIRRHFKSSFSNGTTLPVALDLGSGPGRLTSTLLKTNCYTLTVDISHQMCRVSKKRFKGAQLESVCADMLWLPLRPEVAAIIVSFRAAKYVNGLDSLMCEARRVLDHKGLLLLEMPNAMSPFYIVARLLAIAVRNVFRIPIVNHLVSTGFLSRRQTSKLLHENRLRPVDFAGLSILPLGLMTKITNRLALKGIAGADRMVANNSIASRLARSLVIIARRD